jgi:NAD(P)H-hydrate epimerase
VGSLPYSGAARLAIRAALRAGAGTVSAQVPECIWQIVAQDSREAMVEPLDETVVADRLGRADAAVIGPGLGQSPEAERLVAEALRVSTCPVVLDADGINLYARHIHPLTSCVLTPHEGEFARLGGDRDADRPAETLRLSRALNCVLVRKGPGTLIAAPDGRVMRNTTGNPGMASGGMGDVLAGMLGALLAQGLPLFEAACAAVWLHGDAADRAVRRTGERALLASDVIHQLAIGGCP